MSSNGKSDFNEARRRLLDAARLAPPEAGPAGPGDLAERVLTSRSRRLPNSASAEGPMLTVAAAFALAASILFVVASWSSLVEVVAPRPALFDELVAWETLP